MMHSVEVVKDNREKIRVLKETTKALKTAQEDLRLARARYNMAVSDLVDGE